MCARVRARVRVRARARARGISQTPAGGLAYGLRYKAPFGGGPCIVNLLGDPIEESRCERTATIPFRFPIPGPPKGLVGNRSGRSRSTLPDPSKGLERVECGS